MALNYFCGNISINCFTRWRHSVCCQCTGDPDGRNVIKPAEWRTMFNSSPTPCIFPVCSHQYSPIPGITRTSLTTQLLHRIGQAVGPVVTIRSVRNQIAHSVTATLDDPTFTALWGELSGALHELIGIIADPAWRADTRSQIATLQTCQISREMWENFRRDLLKYLEVRNNRVLVHLSRRLKFTIVITRCPSSVCRPSVPSSVCP